MAEYRYTAYFENEVLRKRPYLKKEWCEFVVENAIREEIQGDSRIRFWARIVAFENRILRFVTLPNRDYDSQRFSDSNFKE